MRTTKSKPLTDTEIVNGVLNEIESGASFSQSKLEKEREKALEYYNGELPPRLNSGQSGYRSLDVMDAVESARAELLEVFAGNKLPFNLRTSVADAMGVMPQAAAYVNKTLFEDNPGFTILDDTIFNSFMSRIAVVKVYWKKDFELFEEELGEVEEVLLDQLAAPDDVERIDAEVDDTGIATGTLVRKRDTSRIVIEVVKPESFILSTAASDVRDRTVGEYIKKRLSVWKSEGYKEGDLLESLDEDERNRFSEMEMARSDISDGTDEDNDRDALDPYITLLEVWTTLDIKRDGNPKGYRLLIAGRKLLEKEETDFFPYITFTPIRIAHQTHGASFVKSIFPTQDAKTVLTRGILDHVVRTNNPRYTVLAGTIDSARELLENRLGGIVNIQKPDGIQPIPQPSLNPFVFQTIQLLDTDLEDTTGLSRLSQGTDKNVISKQNSEGMVAELARKSEKRFRIVARRFAETFLKPLAQLIYRLAQANDDRAIEVTVGGEMQPTTPIQWPASSTVVVDLWLAPEIRKQKAGEIKQTIAEIDTSPTLAPLFRPEKRRELAVKALRLMDIEEADSLFLPEPPPPPPPSPMEQLEMEIKKTEIETRKHQEAISERKIRLEEMKVLAELKGEERQFYFDQMKEQAKMAMEERKQANTELNEAWERQQATQTPPEGKRAFFAV